MKPEIRLPLIVAKNAESIDWWTKERVKVFGGNAWPLTIGGVTFASSEAIVAHCKGVLERDGKAEMWKLANLLGPFIATLKQGLKVSRRRLRQEPVQTK